MSLPSIGIVASEKGWNLQELSQDQRKELLVESMRRDMPLAVAHLHRQAHQADENDGVSGLAVIDPKSELGGQLIRLSASDALRPLAEEAFCHGKQITFVNCCVEQVQDKKKKPSFEQILQMQIEAQEGPIAYRDC